MQALLIKYDDSCFNSLIENLNKVVDDPTLEGVHALRLSIKRIRALLALLDQDKTINDPETIKQINQIFYYSGKLRDIQVQSILLERYRDRVGGVVDSFQQAIIKENKKLKKQFKDQIQRINQFDLVLINQRFDNCIEALSSETLERNCVLKVDRLIDQIIQMHSDNQDDKNLHRIRIKLKELLYIMSIIKKGKLKVNYDTIFHKRLNFLQQKLGDWHDLDLLIDRIICIDKCKDGGNILLFHLAKDKNTIKLEILDNLGRFHNFWNQYKKEKGSKLP